MKVSSMKDDLKLLFSDEYKISDSDYNTLSEILISNNLSELAFDGGLVQLIKLLYENGASLPISVNYLQYLWKNRYFDFNFVKSLVPLVSNGLIRLRKVNKDKLQSGKILHNMSVENENQDKFVVVYGTDKFSDIYSSFSDVLRNYKFELKSFIGEGVSIAPAKIRSSIDRLNRLLVNMKIGVTIESFMQDTSKGIDELNLIFKGISDYDINDTSIQRIVKKGTSKVSYIKSLEVYRESKNELFVGIEMVSQSSYKELPMSLFNAIHELELNGITSEEE